MAKQRVRRTRPPEESRASDTSYTLFALILACFFISGLTGLTYEIVWTRMIVEIIGSSPFAVSIVLTVFMGGLGLGSYIAGRVIDRVRSPGKLVRIYGLLELCVGAYAFVLPVLLGAFKPLYAWLYNRLFDHFVVYNLLTFIGCTVLLIVPVTFMGATLPVLSRFFVTSLSRVSTHVGRLYGLNTIGAAVGSLVCGFWFVDLLGVWGTVLLAVGFNVLIGVVSLAVSARLPAEGVVSGTGDAGREDPSMAEAGEGEGSSMGSYALVIFAVSGFCAMAYEVIWVKLLGLIVGPTTYSFTIVLVTFITGLALGAMFFGWLGDRVRNVMLLLLVTQALAGWFALGFSQVAGNSQIFFAKLIDEFKGSFGSLSLAKAAVLFVWMFPPTFCLGGTFPLVGKVYTRSLSRTGRSIGFAYAVNSVGAVLGSFVAGFVLVPYLGKENGLSVAVGMQLVTALLVGVGVWRRTRAPLLRWAPLGLAALVGVVLAFEFPRWDRKMLSKSKYHRLEKLDIRSTTWLEALFWGSKPFPGEEGERLLYYGDGVGGFTTVLEQNFLGKRSVALCNSGKTDASFPGDMATQTLSAHFAMLFHPDPEDVLIIGLASGVSAGEVLHYPVKRLDVVDINEKVVEASEYFREWNNDILDDPRTNLIIQDGRAHLALTKRKYDVISSEPSNPWMAGLASLFTRDFFELARDRLNDGGIFVQFTHSYEMDWPTFAMVGRTFSDVFPNGMIVNTWPTLDGPDYLLVGIKGGRKLEADVAAGNLKYAQQSKDLTLLDHKLFYNLIVSEDLKRLFGNGRVHTENRPYLEFAAPRLIHTSDPTIGQMVSRRRWLSDETKEIVRRNTMDIDARIDLAAYALSVFSPGIVFRNRLPLTGATPEQKERFSRLVVDYCENNVAPDIFSLEDEELREKCLAAQMDGINRRMVDAKDRVPFLNKLGEISSKSGRVAEAAAYFSQVLLLEPDNAEAHNNIANVLARQKKYDEAVVHHRRAIELAPRNAKTYNNLGCTLIEQGRVDEAIDRFYEALERDPEFSDAHYNIGKAMVSKGRIDEAVRHLTEAVRIQPSHSEAEKELGDALVAQGDYEGALLHYNSALRIDRRDPAAHAGLGNALLARGRTGEAIEHLSKAVELAPDYVKGLNSLAWILATEPDASYRDGARAVALAERACRLAGADHPLLLDTLAAAYAESGEFERARETARRALELARSTGRSQWAQGIETRLELYGQGRSFRAAP